MFWRGLGGTKLALGAGGSGLAVIALIALLLLAFGKCNFLLHPVGSIQSTPTPTASTVVEGTPTPSAAATATPLATATPTAMPTSTPTATPTSATPPMYITSLPWHAGEVSVPYAAVTLGATGGTPPYKWSVDPTGSPIPAGLTLSTDGTVTGNPSATGGPFIVHLEDSAGHAAGAKTTIPISGRFAPTSYCGPNGCSVEQGCTNVCGTYATIVGGVGPYTYVLKPGNVTPPRTTFGGPSIGGTFLQQGPFSFSVDITDSFGVSQPVSALFNVFAPISLTGGTVCCNGSGATLRLPISGGDGKVSNVTLQNLPPDVKTGKPLGVTWSIAGNVVVLSVPTGYANSPVPPPFTVTVFDGSPCGPGTRCSGSALVDFNLG